MFVIANSFFYIYIDTCEFGIWFVFTNIWINVAGGHSR